MIRENILPGSLVYTARWESPRTDGRAIEVVNYMVTSKTAHGVHAMLCARYDARADEWVDIASDTLVDAATPRNRWIPFRSKAFFETRDDAVERLIAKRRVYIQMLERKLTQARQDVHTLEDGGMVVYKTQFGGLNVDK